MPGRLGCGARSPIISWPGDLIFFRYGVRSPESLAVEPGAQESATDKRNAHFLSHSKCVPLFSEVYLPPI